MGYGTPSVASSRAGWRRHLDVERRAVDARTHAAVDHRLEQWSAADDESRTAPFTWSSTVSSTATARFAINCEQRLPILHGKRQRNRAAPLPAARDAGDEAAARGICDRHCRRARARDDRDPRSLRYQAALLLSRERRRVLRVGDQGAVGAGRSGRRGMWKALPGFGQIPRDHTVCRHQYGSTGLLRDRPGMAMFASIRIGIGRFPPPSK